MSTPSKSWISNASIWVPSKENSWELARVINENETKNEILAELNTGETKLFQKSVTHRTDSSHFEDFDDLCGMNHLHEAPLLDCLRRRFQMDRIYTTTGDVLISINPYKLIPGLYDSILSYLDIPDVGDLENKVDAASAPHLYKVANQALTDLVHGKLSSIGDRTICNQSIIVSGESGAGKTEASKYVMSFLIAADEEISSNRNLDQQALIENPEIPEITTIHQDNPINFGDQIRKVLVESNIIFESFGNSKTVRNNNSSRFGKYIKLQYTSNNFIISAYTETFLLEKSRLVSIGENERNYHIFYQLIRGMEAFDVELRDKLKLFHVQQFNILIDSLGNSTTATATYDEDDCFVELVDALRTSGCTDEELQSIWSVLAIILHLGNITCTTDESKDGHVVINSPSIPLGELAGLLGVSDQSFLTRLTTQRVQASNRSSVSFKVLNANEVKNNIAALMKWIYSCLFAWLVNKVNYAHCSLATMNSAETKAIKFIGILDIFGFEILKVNSFEQLCINYTNERLQQQFNEHVFAREQQEYELEGLDWTHVSFRDNQNVIDLIAAKKPQGLLLILEEYGMLNRSPDEHALITTFNQIHDKKSSAYEKSRFGTATFTVKHFAGEVVYSVEGFLTKNNDSLQEDLLMLVELSSHPFIQNAIVSVGLNEPGKPDTPGFVELIPDDRIVHTTAGTLSNATRLSTGTTSLIGPGTVLTHNEADIEPMDGRFSVSTVSSVATTTTDLGVTLRKGGKTTAAKDKSSNQVFNRGQRRSVLTAADGPVVTTKKIAASVTVSFQFRSQLDILLETLRGTTPHYIKCIKPNSNKSQNAFESKMALEQLRYSGVLEVVRIRQEGYPVSIAFHAFYETFELLAFNRGWTKACLVDSTTAKGYALDLCQEYLRVIDDYQFGYSKIFLRNHSFEVLHKAIANLIESKVVKIQNYYRKRYAMKQYAGSIRKVLFLQKNLRMMTKRRLYKKKLLSVMEERRRVEKLRLEGEKKAAEAARIQKEYEMKLLEELRLAEEKKRLMEAQERARLAQEEAVKVMEMERKVAEERAVAMAKEAEERRIELEERQRIENERLQKLQEEEALRLEAEARELAIEMQRWAEIAALEAERMEKEAMKERRIQRLHRVCVLGQYEEVKQMLSEHPEDFTERNVNYFNCSVLHSASYGGNINILKYLEPTVAELHVTDNRRNTVIHYALQSPINSNKLESLKFLLNRIEPNYNYQAYKTFSQSLRPKHDVLRLSDVTESSVSINQTMMKVDQNLERMTSKLLAKEKADDNCHVIIKSGWLSKRGESQLWQKRWVVLTNSCLMYYHNPKDKLPRDTLSFETKNDIVVSRNKEKVDAFDITIVSHQSLLKKRSRISLMADNEQEMQLWLNVLKAAAGVITHGLRNRSSDPPVHCVSPALRQAVIGIPNASKETPLHLIAGANTDRSYLETFESNPDTTTTTTTSIDITAEKSPTQSQTLYLVDQSVADTLLTAAWLVNNGCPVDSYNIRRETPIQIAASHHNIALAGYLAREGCNDLNTSTNFVTSLDQKKFPATSVRSAGIKSLSIGSRLVMQQIGSDPVLQESILQNYGDNFLISEGRFLSTPPQLRGFSYLTLSFQRHIITSKKLFVDPSSAGEYSLWVSIYSPNNELVEAPQFCVHPIVCFNSGSRTNPSSDQMKESTMSEGTEMSEMKPDDDDDSSEQTLLWLSHFHMQNPLDNVEDGTYIDIEFRHWKPVQDKLTEKEAFHHQGFTLVSWLRYVINKSTIDTCLNKFSFKSPPKQLSNVNKQPMHRDSTLAHNLIRGVTNRQSFRVLASTNAELSDQLSGVKLENDGLPHVEGVEEEFSSLEIDVILTQRSNQHGAL